MRLFVCLLFFFFFFFLSGIYKRGPPIALKSFNRKHLKDLIQSLQKIALITTSKYNFWENQRCLVFQSYSQKSIFSKLPFIFS